MQAEQKKVKEREKKRKEKD